LSRLFRKKLLAYLTVAYNAGKLSFYGKLEPLRNTENWQRLVTALKARDWVVYAKPPFGGPRQVLKYLARYTHRVAISNGRLISLKDGKVSFRWKDYARGNRERAMSLDAVEFIRRFLLHVFPTGFVHIRHYGFLANRVREKKLTLARGLLGEMPSTHTSNSEAPADKTGESDQDVHSELCPACKEGRLILIEIIYPDPGAGLDPDGCDTS
jgi:hypothetical protein